MRETEFSTKGALFPFLKRIFSYSLRYRKWMIGFVGFVLLVSLVEALMPLVWMKMLDNAVIPLVEEYKQKSLSGQEYTPDLGPVSRYVGIVLLLGFVLSASVFMFINFAGRIQEYVMYDIRQDLFRKLQELSFSFYDKSAAGWLMSRISSDTIKVTELLSWAFVECIWGFGMIVFCLTAMFIYNWKLALIVAVTIPVLMIVSFKIRQMILHYSRKSRKFNSEITASFNENISGVEVNKSTVQEQRASSEFEALSEKMRASSYRSEFYSALYQPLVIFGGSIAAAFVLYYGGKMAVNVPPEITVGMLAAFFAYATLIYEPILDISRFYSQAQGSLSAGERIFSLLDTQPAFKDRQDAGEFGRIRGEIEFENVSFGYEEGKQVFRGLDLKIKAGTSVALVGETGGGKSTIINLICRFYEPNSGAVKIDGIDYRQMTISSLRSRIGVVLQTPHLFSGSIRENIRYGKSGASDEEIVNSLKLIGADEFTLRLDEEVGEGGERLSLGEKQLVSFARAVLADPSIFIMDEATSSVDTLTEAKIQKGIKVIMKDRTSVIIAHRLSTIKSCDRILVVRKGKITEDGSHHDLMLKKGYYYSLYTRQLREQREKEALEV